MTPLVAVLRLPTTRSRWRPGQGSESNGSRTCSDQAASTRFVGFRLTMLSAKEAPWQTNSCRNSQVRLGVCCRTAGISLPYH
ncbi:hypothetical protein CBM2633_P380023 [Cupriavidus taiwanensis]|uniref:Uncharacterized protein n=1 Tax=Cupriavidus neocaledonicus TaxID=1040979 RepID=A0A375HYZ3_9BURK|nr:hypothetical protein CBM2599_P380023 [Cupriavidus taiwanensis]SOZ32794.1 hypothetical protein CBM2608_P390023 [Cupriavidus taiwanensis]SOZ34091.1 hypothetical protein CBM2609_P370022 [Cupriavidus taiwanensis]SPA23476.1 hypothetical protein CBM2633_P380023 [Cupriavidus taiwanensis]SPD62673.1 protein of unknown function [Cupriavidus neocaledonicus]